MKQTRAIPRLHVRETGPGTPRHSTPVSQRGIADRRAQSDKAARTLTVQQLLDLRGMWQFQCVPLQTLAVEFGVSRNYVRRAVAYELRRHHAPRREDYPFGMRGRKSDACPPTRETT